MLGEQIAVATGKRIVRRILSTEPPQAEVTFEDNGTMLGVAVSQTGTYTSVIRSDGTIFGDGNGMMITADGEMISWKGSGIGRFGAGGSVTYRGMIYYQTASQKLARLNSMCGAFEFDVEAAGGTSGRVWEWK